jgi:GNAT superfamily N-acetyltransferase
MKTIPVKTTYLQMTARAARTLSPPREGIEIVRAEKPAVALYRLLYDAVGRDWHWVDRKLLSDEELGRIIHDDLVEIYVLYVDKVPAGYAELDRRREHEIELAYFGIVPELSGRGLGRYLLDWTVRKAWSYDPQRLWLHTCELDHEAALPLYLSAGFEVFDEKTVEQVVP